MQSNVRGGPFAVLNGALARDVLVVALPAGVALLQPLHVLHVSSAAPADAQAAASNGNGSGPLLAASAPRLLVVLGAEASGELIEEHVSAGEGQAGGRHVSVPVAELALGRGACLKHGYVQREADGAAHFKATLVTQVGGAARVRDSWWMRSMPLLCAALVRHWPPARARAACSVRAGAARSILHAWQPCRLLCGRPAPPGRGQHL